MIEISVTIQDWYRHKIRLLYQENRELQRQIRQLKHAAKANKFERGQTRAESALESVANILVGLAISIAANLLVLPLFGYSPELGEAAGIGVIFTAISLVRSYALRRLFNRRINETLN